MDEQCFVLIKPDAMQKELAGTIISEFYHLGLTMVGLKIMNVREELAEEHYAEHKGKPFYEKLVNHITGKLHGDEKVIAIVYQGENAVKKIREFVGDTHPEKASPLTLRGKYGRINAGNDCFENVVHASDSPINAEREIKLWFSPDELMRVIYPTKKVKVEKLTWK